MKLGGYGRVADGFTIVEVMIVLAVSSMLLISAAALINGRQNRTEFTTAVHDEQQQLEQIINETASGFYPNHHNFVCKGTGSGPVKFSAGTDQQGTNAGCIFLGKSIQFGLGPGSPQDETIGVMPIVGNQYENIAGILTPVLTVGDSVPRAAYPVTGGEPHVPTDTLVTDPMEYGLHIAAKNSACKLGNTAVCYKPLKGGAFVSTGEAAFLSGDSSGYLTGTTSAGTSNLVSGSQQLSLYGVNGGSQDNQDMYNASANLGSLSRATGLGNLVSASEVLICLSSGGTNQSGLFTIGGNGAVSGGNGGLSVTLNVMDDATCQ